MKAIVLVGGIGARLWPLSRTNFPKQFLDLGLGQSLFKQTIVRLLKLFSPSDIVVVANDNLRWRVIAELAGTGVNNIIYEPCARNTAPAIILGVRYCVDMLQADANEIIFVFPSDHLLTDAEKLFLAFQQAQIPAKNGSLVVFGVTPQSPETGYGYIEAGSESGAGFFSVKQFIEKPQLEIARKFVQSDNFYWNSGMFAFGADTLFASLKLYAPELYHESYRVMVENFATLPSISLDYALMEKAHNVALVKLEAGWSDVGSWDSFYTAMQKDEAGNVFRGNVINLGSKNSLVISERLVGVLGVEDTIIVTSRDAVLVAKRGESQGVRAVVQKLQSCESNELTESATGIRPWGSYTILEEGAGYKVKRLEINPQAKISLQRHQRRSEHWVIVSGRARIRIASAEIVAQANEAAYIPLGVLHRLENIGAEVLQVIEVQSGAYLGEDDIVRFDDDYSA